MTFWAAGAAIAGGAIASKGAKSAAKTQAGATDRATEAQERMFDRQIDLNQPMIDSRNAANNQLMKLLGLSGAPTGGGASGSGGAGFVGMPGSVDYSKAPDTYINGQTENPLWERILGDFNAEHSAQFGSGMNRDWGSDADAQRVKGILDTRYRAALASDPQMQELMAKQQQEAEQMKASPEYGSLMRDFTMEDYQEDPGLAFRREQGERGLARARASQGMLRSGSYLKDAMKYNSGLASQEFGNSYDRFNNNNSMRFNRLASVIGAGQTSAGQLGQAAGQFGQQIGSNIMGAGNATAAGQVAGANAWGNTLGQIGSAYQQNQLMNQQLRPSTGYNYKLPDYPGAEY
jgi:hypothetical protein